MAGQELEPAAVKGLIFLGARRWMTRTYGEQGYLRFLETQPPEHRSYWTDSLILPVSWIPAALYVSLFEGEERLWGTGDGRLFQRAAAAVAFDDLSGVMKLFMKVGTPSFIASRFPAIWRRYFSAGELRVEESQPHRLEIELDGARPYGTAGCQGTLGWTRQALEYAGARDLRIDHPECLFAGSRHCIIRYAWR